VHDEFDTLFTKHYSIHGVFECVLNSIILNFLVNDFIIFIS